MHQFYAIEFSPDAFFVTNEGAEFVNIEQSLGWERIMPDTLLQLIAIPGNHSSMMGENENKITLAEAMNRTLLTSASFKNSDITIP
ncbi:hypothetical protein A4R40_05510 [Photorhabdus laumondii subsp. laumondii]|nr:hypothetical protein A4R40_05510 [Photorhabdus laumondii subsp. laumondii]